MMSTLDDFGIPDSVTHEIEVQKKISERREALKTLPNHEELQEVLDEIRFGCQESISSRHETLSAAKHYPALECLRH